jgi:hypothetical protein
MAALLSLLVLAAAGCGNSTVAPTPLPTSLSALTTVRLEGQVLDEHNQPVEGARVTLRSIYPVAPIEPRSVITDDKGSFSLTLELARELAASHSACRARGL